MTARRPFKLLEIIARGDCYQIRSSHPAQPGRGGKTYTSRFLTFQEAKRAAINIAAYDRPSVVCDGTANYQPWSTNYTGYVGSYYADDYVGE